MVCVKTHSLVMQTIVQFFYHKTYILFGRKQVSKSTLLCARISLEGNFFILQGKLISLQRKFSRTTGKKIGNTTRIPNF